jgi:hypothetical protein
MTALSVAASSCALSSFSLRISFPLNGETPNAPPPGRKGQVGRTAARPISVDLVVPAARGEIEPNLCSAGDVLT